MKVTRRQGLIGTLLAPFFTAASEMERSTIQATGGIAELIDKPPMKLIDKPPMNMAAVMAERAKKLAEEKAMLNKFIGGELTSWHKQRLAREYDGTFEDIRSLKSVTKATKERMLLRHKKKKEYDGWMANYKKRLAELMGLKDIMSYDAYPCEAAQEANVYDERAKF